MAKLIVCAVKALPGRVVAAAGLLVKCAERQRNGGRDATGKEPIELAKVCRLGPHQAA